MPAGPDTTSGRLSQAVLDRLANPQRRAALGSRARRLGHPDAAGRVVDTLLAAARTRRTRAAGTPSEGLAGQP